MDVAYECVPCGVWFSDPDYVAAHQAVLCPHMDEEKREFRRAYVVLKFGQDALDALDREPQMLRGVPAPREEAAR